MWMKAMTSQAETSRPNGSAVLMKLAWALLPAILAGGAAWASVQVAVARLDVRVAVVEKDQTDHELRIRSLEGAAIR